MGFLDRILGYALSRNVSKRPSSESVPQPRNENADKILECGGFFASLLDKNKYIAKSEYLGALDQYSSTIDFFAVLDSSGMLADFCKKNELSEAQVKSIISTYKEIEKRVDEHNEEYVSATMNQEKQYLDTLLNAIDSKILLDDDQRRVVLTDEDYCMVIAGAGTGNRLPYCYFSFNGKCCNPC